MDSPQKLFYAVPPPPPPRGWTFLLAAIGVCVGMLAVGTAMWGLRMTATRAQGTPGSAGAAGPATTAVSR